MDFLEDVREDLDGTDEDQVVERSRVGDDDRIWLHIVRNVKNDFHSRSLAEEVCSDYGRYAVSRIRPGVSTAYFHSCIKLINPPTSEASGLSSQMSVASFSSDGHPISSFRDSAQTKVCSIAQTNTYP
jgi:hypothetical protein